jgi:small-conductance mechanosensitive channel
MQLNLNAHHIVLYSVAIALALIGVYLIEARVADNATAKANAAEGKAELIAQQNKDFQTQVAQQVQQLVLQNAQLQQANQALSAQIAQTNAILAQQKKTDASLPPTELAKRIVTLAPGGSITVQTNGYLVDQPEAIAIAQTLEEVPALSANVKALESENANLSTIIANDSKTLDLEKQSHVSDVNSLNAVVAADKVVLAATKAQCRKSKLKWFGIGFVSGFVARHFVGF